MSITPEVPAKTLSELVARQIRIAMAIEDIRQSELARRMSKTEQWLSVRLRGKQAIDLNDLLLFARALNVGVHQLMPSPEEAGSALATERYPAVAIQMGHQKPAIADRPIDNRPAGRPHAATAPGRTGYVTRRKRDR